VNVDDARSLPDSLDADVIELRRARPEYAEPTHDAIVESFDDLHDWLRWAESLPTVDDLSATLAEDHAAFDLGSGWVYLMFDPTTSQVVGGAGLHRRNDPDDLEIGYWVRSRFNGRGSATAAARALTEAAFRYLPWVRSVTIKMDQSNSASVRVPQKLGFVLAREETRPIVTPRHTGRGYVWTATRETWQSS
jgi:RimJ/RimL family protein N-acetyltransferase